MHCFHFILIPTTSYSRLELRNYMCVVLVGICNVDGVYCKRHNKNLSSMMFTFDSVKSNSQNKFTKKCAEFRNILLDHEAKNKIVPSKVNSFRIKYVNSDMNNQFGWPV